MAFPSIEVDCKVIIIKIYGVYEVVYEDTPLCGIIPANGLHVIQISENLGIGEGSVLSLLNCQLFFNFLLFLFSGIDSLSNPLHRLSGSNAAQRFSIASSVSLIAVFSFFIRIINCLHRNKVVTVAELVQLKDKEIMAMNGMGKAAIKDIRKKQNAYIKELLIELVTNEITEISTREVVNVLGEPV